MLISVTSIVIISQQYFLYSPAIFIPMNAKSIPAPTRQPPQISILISQYIILEMTGLDIPLLICATFFPVSIIHPAMFCMKVTIVSMNTTQSEMNTFDCIIWEKSSRYRIPYQQKHQCFIHDCYCFISACQFFSLRIIPFLRFHISCLVTIPTLLIEYRLFNRYLYFF